MTRGCEHVARCGSQDNLTVTVSVHRQTHTDSSGDREQREPTPADLIT